MRTRSIALLAVVLVLLIAPSVEAGKPGRTALLRPGGTDYCANAGTAAGSVSFRRMGNSLAVSIDLRGGAPNATYLVLHSYASGQTCPPTGFAGSGSDSNLTTDARGHGRLSETIDLLDIGQEGASWFAVSLCQQPFPTCADLENSGAVYLPPAP